MMTIEQTKESENILIKKYNLTEGHYWIKKDLSPVVGYFSGENFLGWQIIGSDELFNTSSFISDLRETQFIRIKEAD